jgi:hypothetical protein
MGSVVISFVALALGVVFCVWFVRSRATAGKAMKKQMFADRYGTCLSCGSPPVGHSAWMLAMAIVSRQPNRVPELERLVAQGKWAEAGAIQEFEGTEDEIEYRVIRCPVTNELSLKKIVSVFDLWSNDSLLEDIRLSPADQERLAVLAGEKWSVL